MIDDAGEILLVMVMVMVILKVIMREECIAATDSMAMVDMIPDIRAVLKGTSPEGSVLFFIASLAPSHV